MYWYWDPPIITSISLFLITISLIDYGIPRICTYMSQPQQWTAANGTHSSFGFSLHSNYNLIFFSPYREKV
jgi:hypothetical protein